MKIFLVILCKISIGVLSEYTEDWESLDNRPLPSWYDEAKVGIFIHWGLYSVPAFGSEWFWYYWKTERRPEFEKFVEQTYGVDFEYSDFVGHFKAKRFDPNEWAKLFVQSGARYVVLTSKHHDGYALWKSNMSWNWNSVDTGPHRDIVGEVCQAVKSHNLSFGLYYSLYEWYNPWYTAVSRTETFPEKVMFELTDLVETYKPNIIWSDGDWDKDDEYWQSKKFLAYLYNKSPVKNSVVVNDRWGSGAYCLHGGFWNCKDHFVPNSTIVHKWENAFSLDKKSWGNRADLRPEDVFTAEELIKELVRTVSLNGNVLINVGPRSDGTIPTILQERLMQLGAWLKVNGEAIYGTRPFSSMESDQHDNIWFTTKDRFIYAIFTDIEVVHESILRVKSIPPVNIEYVSLLGCPNSSKINWTYDSPGITVYLSDPCRHSLQWAFVLSIQLSVV